MLSPIGCDVEARSARMRCRRTGRCIDRVVLRTQVNGNTAIATDRVIEGVLPLAVVPILAVVAIGDSAMHFSLRLSRIIKFINDLWAHFAVLVLVSIAYFVWLFNVFDMRLAFTIVDYVDVQYQFFINDVQRKLLIFDVLAIVVSTAATLFISIKQRRNILLSALAGILGNIGTIVWMARARRAS